LLLLNTIGLLSLVIHDIRVCLRWWSVAWTMNVNGHIRWRLINRCIVNTNTVSTDFWGSNWLFRFINNIFIDLRLRRNWKNCRLRQSSSIIYVQQKLVFYLFRLNDWLPDNISLKFWRLFYWWGNFYSIIDFVNKLVAIVVIILSEG